MALDWNVSREMVDQLLAEEVGGVKNRLQALAVFQHCSLKDLSLFEFFQTYTVDGLQLVSVADRVLVADVSVVGESVRADWKFADWRDDPSKLISWRLERLRKHIAEVRIGGDVQYLGSLLNFERQMARQCEPVPTLGLVADDPVDDVAAGCDDVEEPEADEESQQPEESPQLVAEPELSPVVDPLQAERDDIDAVFQNPKSAVVAPELERKDSKGRVLVKESTLKAMYAAAKLIGFANDIATQEMLCAKVGVSSVHDVTEAAAVKIIDAMKQQLGKV
jgi:hypothetical protein